MSQYVLNPSSFQSGHVGNLYHIGLSDGNVSYGYMFRNQGGSSSASSFNESSNIADKASLIQYASPNLIDRDIAYYPRITQGDFSGGGLQTVFLDPTKYFDSDLEIRTPGYLTLRPGWRRQLIASAATGTYQCATLNNDVYTCFNTANVYNSAGTAFLAPFNVKFIDTDGFYLYVGDGVNSIANFNGSVFLTLVTNAGSFVGMWIINLGTSGRLMFLAQPPNNGVQTLIKYDMSTFASQISVPLGSMTESIVDIAPYQNGIAILTKEVTAGDANLWFHDGANLTRITHIPQYLPIGLTNCLGNLYITAQSQGAYEGPVLISIASGSVQIVARWASPIAGLTNSMIGFPISTGQYVYCAISNPQINYVSSASYIGVYDTVTTAISHMGNLDASDNPQVTQPRQLAASGRAVAFPMSIGNNTYFQYQTNTNKLVAGNTFVTSGSLVSSRLDFATPGIPKRFRRIEAVHAPLQSGESINIKSYVDGDQFHLGQTPLTAQITNNIVGTTQTNLIFGADIVGRTMYYNLTLAGNGSTTPDVQRIAVEVGGTWTWTLDLDCTSTRRTLQQGGDDPQGITGKDLYYLLRNSYENGTFLTLYLAEGLTYTVTIESLSASTPSYLDHLQSTVRADQEFQVHVVLKQVA